LKILYVIQLTKNLPVG